MSDPNPAYENLRSYQRQLDADGCEVGVSRQALDEILEAFDALRGGAAKALEKATEMPMNDCGLTINTGRDGTCLHFTARSGKSASINVENWANSKDGGVTAQALRDWAADRQEQAAAIGSSRG